MIETIFEDEKGQLKNIINSKNVLQNISYKLMNDMNSIHFFENVIDNILKFKSFDNSITKERMHKYYFLNDFNEMYIVLNLFYRGLKADPYIKDKSGAELQKCCSLFPDHIGERILKLLSYLPIMNLFNEINKYEKYLSSGIDLNEKSCGQTYAEYQEDRIFNLDGILRNKFPDDSEFIDHSMKNRYIDVLEKEYNDKKEDFDSSLQILLNLYSESENIDDTKILMGLTFWDKSNDSNNIIKFKESLNSLMNVFEADHKEKLNKCKTILEDEISKILGVDNLKSEISKTDTLRLFNYKIFFKDSISKESLHLIEKIFFIKRDVELTDLHFILKNDDFFEFSCKIEL